MRPQIISNPMSAMVLEHDRVTLTCEVSGNPQPMVIWEREGSKSLPVLSRQMTSIRSVLENTYVTLYNVRQICTYAVCLRVLSQHVPNLSVGTGGTNRGLCMIFKGYPCKCH